MNALLSISRFLLLFIFVGWGSAFGQTRSNPLLISGKITELNSGQGIPFASIAVKGKTTGAQADADGRYELHLRQPADTLLVSALGYQTMQIAVVSSALDISLTPAASVLNEVVVHAGENPAFHILRELHAHRKQNDFRQLDSYDYEAYSQLAITINHLSDQFKQRKPIQAILHALEQKQGRSAPELPVFLSETVSHLYARRHPQLTKEQVQKTNITSLGITDDSFVALFTGAGFNTLNFYQNQVSLFKKEFMSPLAEGGRMAYTYFLADTAQIGQHSCYGIDFDPKNERDLVFRGRMWIDTQTYALVRIEARVGDAANINFINQIDIDQTYELVPDIDHAWLPETTHLTVSVGEVVKNTFGASVDYTTTIRQPVVGIPKPVNFFDTDIALANDRAEFSSEYWKNQRQQAGQSQNFDQTRALLDTVRHLPIVQTYTKIAQFVLNGGYLPLARGLDIGSLFSMWAYNPVEGHRLRLGVQTNNAFSRTWQLAAYGAYGTRDRVWKTGFEVNFIPTRNPLTLVTLKHSYDLEQLGFRTEDLADNSFFRVNSRFGPYPRAFYQRETALTAQRDLGPNFTQTVGVRYRSMHLLFPFSINQDIDTQQPSTLITDLLSKEYFLETRYAPGRLPARRVTSRRIRRRPSETAPIVTFRYTLGTASYQGRAFKGYHKWQLQWDHTLRWGLVGRTQYTVKAGYSPSTIPYPLLQVHLGNQTPFYNRNAFNLMNYAEFVSDRYVSVAVEHKFEGLFTNRLPLIRRWGWRSFVTGTMLWGQLSKANRELIATQDATGKLLPRVHSLHQIPYVEVGYGFENVLKSIRIEAMHRLTYRQNPNVTPFAVKLSFQIGL
ncbi:carboxypeptidase-like regulatory domain-containing protein [Spirosoma sp. KCTC 42546]|uniref:DUF5686 and carboxypeptidase-like regulatory domain-containing protein n=1 Tax=Spirosoma sp. KCTC 42546 TaxID=2520506 RepID=UPI00115A13D3|nr:DUF5686 and carboxypeptidase-like regulatory domain-containing protein [Spirosoma sp. KCTC 42546]QDK79795.1 carboxypeptidase-like regulatory domain-containing protein [Spirosoma sp. KCTC 42546]